MQPEDKTEIKATNAKQHLISEEKFHKLKQFQRDVFEITEFSPSMRKIINELITEENLENIKAKFITMWK